MDGKENRIKKKFKLKDYKGYIVMLMGLFIILFVLISIAIGMIRDQYGFDSAEDRENEIETENIKESSDQKDTGSEMESETEIETVGNHFSVNKDDPLLVLINRHHPVSTDIRYTLVKIEEEHYIDERAYDDLQKMMSDAEKAGYELVICSSWRSYEVQETLYNNKIDEYLSYGYSKEEAKELAAFWVALPGTSEHEIGLALDIVSKWYQHLDHDQAYTAEQEWLMEHCYEYGFILRYPEDKQDMTYIGYEPWHYRYVGKEAAKEITEQGLCLEEYLGEVE